MDSIETHIASECQIKMKWRIKEDALKEAINNSNGVIVMKSECFKAPKIWGVEYCLLLTKEEENQIILYLALVFEMARKIDARFNLSVKSASYMKNGKAILEKTNGCGKTFCTRDELFDAEKKFFVNGIMEIELEGTLKALGIKRKAPESSSLGDVLWESEKDKDLTIAVKDQELKVHKWILCAKSPVFKAEMESGMTEARENRIEITDFSFETVKIAIEHSYERDIKKLITEENASELLHFADKYDMKLLHHNIQFTLIDKTSESNVVQLANASVTSNAKELGEFCVCFLINAIGKSSFIKDVKKLHQEITNEIVQRSVFPIAE